MDKGPLDVPALDYIVNMGAAMLGGAVRFIKEWRANYTDWDRKRVFFEGVLNALYAGFAALLTFFLLLSWKVDPFYSAFACGIVGHMGPEGINLLKELITNAMHAKQPPQE